MALASDLPLLSSVSHLVGLEDVSGQFSVGRLSFSLLVAQLLSEGGIADEINDLRDLIEALDSGAYKGTWNAATNTPELASGVGTDKDRYLVSTPGSTELDGISSWFAGDQLVFSDAAGGVWQRIAGTTDSATLAALAAKIANVFPTEAICAPSGTQARVEFRLSAGALASAMAILLGTGALSLRNGTRDSLLIDTAGNVIMPFTPDAPKPIGTTPTKDMVRKGFTPWGEKTEEREDLVVPQLYHVSAGDAYHQLVVQTSDRTLQCEHLAAGFAVEIHTDGVGVRLDAGIDREWFGVSGSPRFIDVSADAIVQIRALRTGSNKLRITVLAGSPTIAASASQLEAIADKTVAMMFQSLGYRLFNGFGLEGIQRALRDAGYTATIRFINLATPNTSLLEGNDTGTGHWVKDDHTAGSLLLPALVALASLTAAQPGGAGQPAPSAVVANGGQNEVTKINDNAAYTTMAAVSTGYQDFGDLIDAAYPGCKLIVTPLPSRDGQLSGVTWQQLVRRAQLDAIATSSKLALGEETYDLIRRPEDVHMPCESQRIQGYRLGKILHNIIGGGSNYLGPVITKITRVSDTTLDFTVDWSGGAAIEAQYFNEGWPDWWVTAVGAATKNQTYQTPIKCDLQATVGSTRRYRLTFATTLPADLIASYPGGYCDNSETGRGMNDNTNVLPLRSVAMEDTP
jgi:hypothetical protein